MFLNVRLLLCLHRTVRVFSKFISIFIFFNFVQEKDNCRRVKVNLLFQTIALCAAASDIDSFRCDVQIDSRLLQSAQRRQNSTWLLQSLSDEHPARFSQIMISFYVLGKFCTHFCEKLCGAPLHTDRLLSFPQHRWLMLFFSCGNNNRSDLGHD